MDENKKVTNYKKQEVIDNLGVWILNIQII